MTMPRYASKEVCCLGKDKLQTMNLAKDVARRMSARHDTHITPYRCPHCNFFHVGEHSKGSKFYGKQKRTG